MCSDFRASPPNQGGVFALRYPLRLHIQKSMALIRLFFTFATDVLFHKMGDAWFVILFYSTPATMTAAAFLHGRAGVNIQTLPEHPPDVGRNGVDVRVS